MNISALTGPARILKFSQQTRLEKPPQRSMVGRRYYVSDGDRHISRIMLDHHGIATVSRRRSGALLNSV
jgi:hypothetical protein